jgi:hypothetical protein
MPPVSQDKLWLLNSGTGEFGYTGDIVHSLRISGAVEELYDVAALPRLRRPMAIGFITDEIRRAIAIQTELIDSC